jgi:hypothetical protein
MYLTVKDNLSGLVLGITQAVKQKTTEFEVKNSSKVNLLGPWSKKWFHNRGTGDDDN